MSDHFNFRQWITEQSGSYQFVQDDNDHMRLVTEYAVAQINYYQLDEEPEIVEFRIDTNDGETKFFLHFHANHEEHAKGLFAEMVQTLSDLRKQQKKEILLCCTSGLTTSFFAEKLNEEAQNLDLPYEFSAVSVSDIYEAGVGKAAILLAPQIRYMEKQLSSVMQDSVILSIPTKIFGMYDALSCVRMVDEEIQKLAQTKEEKAMQKVNPEISNDQRIMVISAVVINQVAHLFYRIYDHGKIELDEVVKKKRMNIRDIEDILDTQVCSCSGEMEVDKVGIAMPGIIHNGSLDLPATNNTNFQHGQKNGFAIKEYFEEKYKVPFSIDNNTNAAAIGWYGQQDQYKNIVFYSQPRGWTFGGQGFVVDGKVMGGFTNSAGEIKYVMNHFRYSNPLRFSPFNPDDMLEIVVNVLLMDISIMNPEVICVRSELTPDMDVLRNELLKYVPDYQIPKLVYIDDYNEYIMLGEMLFCLENK